MKAAKSDDERIEAIQLEGFLFGASELGMGASYGIAQCPKCGALIVDEPCHDDPGSSQCPGCGKKANQIVSGTQFDLKAWRSGMSRQKGLLVRGRMAFVKQWMRGGALAHLERVFDWGTDPPRYHEKVTMCDTGEVIHSCDEPLSQHRGHGSARRQR